MQRYDVVIRRAMVADGLGSPLFEADIALDNGRIVIVGDVAEQGREEFDAKGLLATPGFVDIHTHYDGQAMWDTRLRPSSAHGVTTAVMGNCGVGFAPVHPHHREMLVELMEGVEDIPGAALHEGLDWKWESFGDYLDALERRERDIDICAQLPHGALRVYVMGQRGADLEPATARDIARMRELTAQAMRAGAIGFSTTRSLNHRTIKGDPTPMLRATEEELTGIALGMQDAGRGVFQLVSDFDTPGPEEEFEMIRNIARRSGRPVSISISQRHATPEKWKSLLAMIADAVAEGLEITAQIAPRPIGVLLGLQGSRNPFSACPSYRAIAKLPLAERIALMQSDAALKMRLVAEAEAPADSPISERLVAWFNMFPFSDPPDYAPPLASSIGAQAQREGRSPAAIAYESLLQDDGRAFLFTPFANYADGNLDVCRAMIAHPNTVIGLGDGGAHVSIISDASFPTYLLSHWGREAVDGFDVSWLVKRQTSDTARVVGLHDRGVIAPGMKADLNLIDLAHLSLASPRMHSDLPAGGKRLLQEAHGYVATIVAGRVVYRNGEPTSALPGRLVRGPQAAVTP